MCVFAPLTSRLRITSLSLVSIARELLRSSASLDCIQVIKR